MLLSIFVCIALTSCGKVGNDENVSGSEEIKTENANDIVEITPEEYDEIREGMTYEEVCEIIGGEPRKNEVRLGKEKYLSFLVEDAKNRIDKEEIKADLDKWMSLYLSYLNDSDWDHYIEQKNAAFDENTLDYSDERNNLISSLENQITFIETRDKYTWLGQNIYPNPEGEYRGFATIFFRDGLVIFKLCQDLE